MKEITERPICHRADDMMAFLYGEASPVEAEDFANHVKLCASCRTEFSVFSQVRESVSQWRSEVLGAGWRAKPVTEPEPLPASVVHSSAQRRTALGALREFFEISPMWLRGAMAMASLVFCVLVALFFARMVKTPERLYTQQEVNTQINNRVEQLMRDQPRIASDASKDVLQPGDALQAGTDLVPTVKVKHKSVPRSSRQFLSRAEREQLAADLGLEPGYEEDDLLLPLDGGSN
jgi:putative zinc finger protein